MKYTKNSGIDNLNDLARHLNKNKEDITKQDVFDHVDEYFELWLTSKPPSIVLDGEFSMADLKLILEFAESCIFHEQSE